MTDFPGKSDKHGGQPDYSVEDILEEAQRLKKERQRHEPPAPLRPAITAARKGGVTETAAPGGKSFPAEKGAAAAGEETVKVYVPRSAQPAPAPPPLSVSPAAPASVPNPPGRLQNGGTTGELEQIRLDSLLETLPPEAEQPPVREEEALPAWEEQLRQQRKKKAEEFRLQSPAVLRLSGEEEENDPDEEAPGADEEIDDFGCYEDAAAVRGELNYRCRTGWLQLVLTAAFSLTLLGSSVIYALRGPDINAVLIIGLNLFLLGIVSLLNHRSLGEGVAAFFHGHGNSDSMTAALVLLTSLHALVQLADSRVLGGTAVVTVPLAGLALFFSALGRQMMTLRISRNFQFVSHPSEKAALNRMEDTHAACEIGRTAVALGDPDICYAEKSGFLSHFLENSYEPNPDEQTMRRYIPAAIGASLLLGIVYGAVNRSVTDGLTAAVAALCLSTPMGAMTTANFPLLRAAHKLLRHGAMMTGWQAAEEFGGVHALAADALDLFPGDSVLLHGIKTFSGARIDEAILDAAAVSVAAGGPLSSLFRRVIQNRTDILKPVDTLVYEQDMGMSGWVGGRRVLIGNRRLLENHGVDVPSRDYEARYTSKEGRKVVYLSTAGELTAMFVVSYVAEPGAARALQAMTASGISLIVRTCDPNVTEEMICDIYGLDPYYVEVMSAAGGRCFEKIIAKKSEETPALLASDGRLEGTAYAVAYSRRVRRAVRFGLIVQIVGGSLGLAVCLFLALFAGEVLSPPVLSGCVLAWTAVSWLLAMLYRV